MRRGTRHGRVGQAIPEYRIVSAEAAADGFHLAMTRIASTSAAPLSM